MKLHYWYQLSAADYDEQLDRRSPDLLREHVVRPDDSPGLCDDIVQPERWKRAGDLVHRLALDIVDVTVHVRSQDCENCPQELRTEQPPATLKETALNPI